VTNHEAGAPCPLPRGSDGKKVTGIFPLPKGKVKESPATCVSAAPTTCFAGHEPPAEDEGRKRPGGELGGQRSSLLDEGVGDGER
jgi:hypothetical protein